jgi:hypothetical protein
MQRVFGILAVLLALPALAQQTSATATIPAGNGSPTSQTPPMPCDMSHASSSSGSVYLDRSITVGNAVWKCTLLTDGITYQWNAPFVSPVLGTATTGTFASQSYLLSGCTSVLTVTIAGATVGTNAVTASPIYATAPTATNPGLLNVTAWVSSANTISVQGCATGVLGTMPAFTAKVLMY